MALPNQFPEESRWLRQVNENLKEKSQNLSTHGGKIASALAKGVGAADNLSINKFRSALAQVVDLDKQVTIKMESILSRSPGQARPKLVQNHQKQDKT